MEAAQKMLMFTSRYFRYLFQVNNNFVPLINELAHAEDYLSIQNLRLSRVAEYSTNLPADCNQLNIPPLLLITFVENSIKHATVPDGESLKISIDCRKLLNEENADGDILEIVISDNGQGFDPEVLKKLQDGEDILSDDRSHHCFHRQRYRKGPGDHFKSDGRSFAE
ncbi:MAG: histidine kinase [Butyrivibrio sp.]|nr:histidine kinase [Butyrivibrio sp.]